MEFQSPSHAWAAWLDRPGDLTLVAEHAAALRAALDALAAGDTATARRLWASIPGDELLAAWNAQVVAMRDYTRWPEALRETSTTERVPDKAAKVGRALSRQIFERDGYRCGYCGIPVVTQWQRGDIPRLVAAFPDLTPHLTCVNGSIFVHSTPTNENCAKWLWFGAVADHIEPASKDGETDPENLITACGGCNYGKMDWTLEQLSVRRPSVPAMPPRSR
jgi:hypothetical protein